jgi:hypothetical protein
MKRIFLGALLALSACASAGTIAVTGTNGTPHFEFERRGKAIIVGGIDVYERKNGRRTRAVCSLNTISRWLHDMQPMTSWDYGRDVGTNYRARDCERLRPGHEYGVNLSDPVCVAGTRFRLSEDGIVQDIGPHWGVCGR